MSTFLSFGQIKQGLRTFKIIATSLFLFMLSTTAQAGWQINWIEKFDGSSVNWNNWTAQIQANYNNEVQCYTDDESSTDNNYDVSDGTLKIIARKQAISCPGLGGAQKSWTSGRLNSKDKAEFLYGRIEARIKFHNLEGGTWPAFWMIENRIDEHPKKGDDDFSHWPQPGAGEIDVWEWFSNQPNTYITNFFNTNSCGSEVRYTYPTGGSEVLQWHKYAMEWDENNISFFIDDTLITSHDISACAQYKEPMFVLLNVAMGGNLGGSIDSSLTKATMEVDYVAHCTPDSSNSLTYCDETTVNNTVILDDDQDGVRNELDLCPETPLNSIVDNDGCESLPNQAPVAVANGATDKVYVGDYVQLSADGSIDADDDTLLYLWSQTAGPQVELLNITSISPTFKAPEVTEQTSFSFKVEVTDGKLTDTAVVTQDVHPVDEITNHTEANNEVEDNNKSSSGSMGTLTIFILFLLRRNKFTH